MRGQDALLLVDKVLRGEAVALVVYMLLQRCARVGHPAARQLGSPKRAGYRHSTINVCVGIRGGMSGRH